MGIPNSTRPLFLAAAGQAAGGAGYEIERSLRFNSSDSAYLSRTPASAGNRRTYTYSTWVKRAALGTGTYYLFTAVDGGNVDIIGFEVDRFYWYNSFSGSVNSQNLYRDPSAWYHVLASVDSTQAIGTDRVKLYVNGAEVAYAAALYPSLNRDFAVNNTVAHKVGQYFTTNSSNFYLADVHFIDGQALDPTSFGEFDTNGVWQPKAYADSYGTNGFRLPFSDNSTAAALGYDAAGSNDWTVNNLSVAAGSGNDSLVDSPTNGSQTDTGVGGEVVGNYCTLNPLWNNGHILSNGNLNYAPPSPDAWTTVLATFGMPSGKWYWEQTYISGSANCMAGFGNVQSTLINYPTSPNSTGYDFVNGAIYGAGAGVPAGATLSAGDIMGISVDVDAGEAKFYKNGVLQTTLTHGITGTLFPLVSSYDGVGCVNFGQRPFAYPVSGFKALCTTNLPEPTIADGSTVMDVVLYTGNGLARDITGYNFSPDLVWIKSRSAATDHGLYDIVRGVQQNLTSNNTVEELDYSPNYLSAFNSDGFSIGGAGAYVNTNTSTYVAWAWDAGSSTVSNEAGSITSQVRANASAGFSIVTYTGNGAASGTIGHGLNAAPQMIMVKNRDVADEGSVYHVGTDAAAPQNYFLKLFAGANGTADRSDVGAMWNDTAPTSAVFSVGTEDNVNASTEKYVAYCFAPVEGYSAFGSYTGNGLADGPFVYTGFRPRWLLIKRADGVAGWYLFDSERLGYNPRNELLYPNFSNAEANVQTYDLLSNGFKVRTLGTVNNASGGTYVWAAFAEHPFATSRGR